MRERKNESGMEENRVNRGCGTGPSLAPPLTPSLPSLSLQHGTHEHIYSDKIWARVFALQEQFRKKYQWGKVAIGRFNEESPASDCLQVKATHGMEDDERSPVRIRDNS